MHQPTREHLRATALVHSLEAQLRHPLAVETLNRLRAFFTEKDHRPSSQQWAALADLARTLEDMANGTAAPKFFLSSLDPGVGKSQTLAHFVDTLLASRRHEHVGILICVSRLTEVSRFVDEGGIPREMLCVATSDASINALGGIAEAAANGARVVLTTQQRIEKRLKEYDGSFAVSGLFPFNGMPRQVRVWDEAFLPGEGITVNRVEMQGLAPILASVSRDLRTVVDDIQTEVKDMKTGDQYMVPDFVGEDSDELLNRVLAACGNNEGHLRAISALWCISGKTVAIHKDGDEPTALDYRETLSTDLAPMVITDASGRVRTAYRDMEVERRTLVRLKTAAKRYDRLTVNVWTTPGSKSGFKANSSELCAGVAKTIESKPTEKWLVVCHKPDDRTGDTEKTVRALLQAAPQENVSFITWGNHSATNEFVKVPNVVLAGTLFYRSSQYDALKRLSSGRKAADNVTKDELRETTLGEHAHLILQALCRGAVRQSDGEHCRKAEAWIIAGRGSGIHGHLPTIFPGCAVRSWRPIKRDLTGYPLAVSQYVRQWATKASVGDVLSFREIQKALGIGSAAYRDGVRRCADLRATLSELGIEECGKRYMTGYRLEAVSDPNPPN